MSSLAGFESWLTPTSAKAARRTRGPVAPPVFVPPMTVPPGEGGVPRVPPGIPGGFPGPVPAKPPYDPIMPGGVPGPIPAKPPLPLPSPWEGGPPTQGFWAGGPGERDGTYPNGPRPVPAPHELLGHAARQHALGQLALFQQAAPIVNDRQLHDLLATPGDPLQKYPLVYARLHQLAAAAGAPDVVAWLHSLVNGRL